jgi:hypothetical protein
MSIIYAILYTLQFLDWTAIVDLISFPVFASTHVRTHFDAQPVF